MSKPRIITVRNKDHFRKTLATYAAQGFQTLRDEGDRITMSKRKTFNWPAAIVCLFIPIIGWIALLFMLLAAGRGSEVIEIVLKTQTA